MRAIGLAFLVCAVVTPGTTVEITMTFRVTDKSGHDHAWLVVSPYGYSTCRGN